MFFPCVICFILRNGHSNFPIRNENPFFHLHRKGTGKVLYQRVSVGGKRYKNKFLRLKRRRSAGNSINSNPATICKSVANESHTERLLDLYETLPLYDTAKELQTHIRYCYLHIKLYPEKKI